MTVSVDLKDIPHETAGKARAYEQACGNREFLACI